jgi:hypothetical protein
VATRRVSWPRWRRRRLWDPTVLKGVFDLRAVEGQTRRSGRVAGHGPAHIACLISLHEMS